MSLHITVGQLAHCVAMKDRRAVRQVKRKFEKVNEVLRGAKVTEHVEPEDLGGNEAWGCRIVAPRLQPLRRLAAHVRLALIRSEEDEPEGLTEWPEPWDYDWGTGWEDPVMAEYYQEGSELFDQLMQHSDSAGYYLPLDFYEPPHPAEDLSDAVGGIIGSSQGLLSDCQEVARMIGLPADMEPDSKCLRDVGQSGGTGNGWWRYPQEREVCLKLITACKKSIEWKAAIVFAG